MAGGAGLVIGATGLVGRALMRALGAAGIEARGTYATRPVAGLLRLDITDEAQVGDCLRRLRPATVYLTAALTHVDYCEDHPDEAFNINAEGPRAVASAARDIGAKLVFYSTEYVFDGRAGPYDEDAAPNPLSVYGRTKLAAERAILEAAADALILRTTVVFGWDPHSKNFAMQIYERVQKGLAMTVPADQVGTPTLAAYLADASVRLVEKRVSGLVNVVGNDLVPRTDFARALVRLFGGNVELVIPVTTASLRQKAARPLRGGLRTAKLRALLGEEPISIDESLRRLEVEREGDSSITHA